MTDLQTDKMTARLSSEFTLQGRQCVDLTSCALIKKKPRAPPSGRMLHNMMRSDALDWVACVSKLQDILCYTSGEVVEENPKNLLGLAMPLQFLSLAQLFCQLLIQLQCSLLSTKPSLHH